LTPKAIPQHLFGLTCKKSLIAVPSIGIRAVFELKRDFGRYPIHGLIVIRSPHRDYRMVPALHWSDAGWSIAQPIRTEFKRSSPGCPVEHHIDIDADRRFQAKPTQGVPGSMKTGSRGFTLMTSCG
jgi:hypothetical protein